MIKISPPITVRDNGLANWLHRKVKVDPNETGNSILLGFKLAVLWFNESIFF